MKKLLQLIILHFSLVVFSQNISGIVLSEDNIALNRVLIVNMSSEQKVYSNHNGEFSIQGTSGDEIRFAKEGFERALVNYTNQTIVVKLKKITQQIEEVVLQNKKNQNYSQELRQYLGLPKVPEKPREKPADLMKELVRIPPIVNFQSIYDVVSGKAKRQKRYYNYDDLQDNIKWIRDNTDDDYYEEIGIPKERINEFLMVCLEDEKVKRYVKVKNALILPSLFEEHLPEFLKRLVKK